ncbi:MAG: proline dehydrogenase family protein [Dehalococcoidia bacterium]
MIHRRRQRDASLARDRRHTDPLNQAGFCARETWRPYNRGMARDALADPGIEAAIVERGRQLLERVEPERLINLTPAWWQERLMAWATQDPDFRTRLLRFVDVLPTLRTTGAVADHVRQYFRDDAPGVVRLGSRVANRRLVRPMVSRVVRHGVFTMAGRFIGGATPEEALPRLRELVEQGTGYTIDLLGEATLSDAEADEYQRRYLELIEVLSTRSSGWGGPDDVRQPNVSVKLSALTAHFEPAAPAAVIADVERRFVPILELARARGVFVNVDMEQYRYRDLVQRIVEHALTLPGLRDWEHAGIVVQAYLVDAADDIARIRRLAEARGSPLTVRLVKGAYWDEETIVARQEGHRVPVFEDKRATDANYERCTELLIDGYPHLRPAFASHNPRSIAQAMVRAEAASLPRDDVEFQMLYGMAEGLRKAVHAEGYRTRVYVPAGEIIPGMAYLVRRLLENTSNESWLVHRHEEADPEVALARPEPSPGRPAGPPPRFQNHPHAEFHLPRDRERMASAIEKVRAAAGRSYAIVIDGREVQTGEWIEVRPPAHPRELLGRVARAGKAEAEAAVAAAKVAFPAWRDTDGRERAGVLRRAAGIMAERRFELAAIEVFESAKPWREADSDITEAIDFLRYYALQAEDLADGEDLSLVPAETNRLLYEGRGVAAIIAPWNFPLAIITGMAAGALAGGCTVVLKPAEQSPIIASHLASILAEAGVPRGVVNYCPGPGRVVGEALVAHPDVAMIAFTGSNAVGTHIYAQAARIVPGQPVLKRVIAELGGKNAIIVDDDADLDQAVEGTLTSAFGYAGQKCSACSRVIVVGSAYDEFRARLAAGVESLVVGPPEEPQTFVPPVISARAKEAIEGYIALGERQGTLVARGRSRDDGHYVAPHVFEDIPRDSRLSCEEVFGPVLALYRAGDFEEALAMALDSPFALTGGVFSRNPRHIARAGAAFRVGNLYINRKITGSMVGRQPFAGFRMSGTGEKAGGPDYVRHFMLPRVVTENTMRRGFAPQ